MLCGGGSSDGLLPGASGMKSFSLLKAAGIRWAGFAVLLAGTGNISAQSVRPHITGISHLCVYASDPAAAEHFYVAILGARKEHDPEDANGARYYFSSTQYAEVLPLPADHTISRMNHVAFNTDDASALRAYLLAHQVAGVSELHKSGDGELYFDSKDPEGNKVQFVQPAPRYHLDGSPAISDRVIHIGFMVHEKAAEDRFYKELLGFRPYWFGAMQPGKVDWVSSQVPDGHDWLEYMLVGDGSTTPLAHIDQRELGVLNHFSLGVQNMEQAMTIMISQDRLSPRHDGPQMGKDGKWQANFYDPDGTRVEFMEFQPVMKPCCSPFTADSPMN
jgi:catechol 2,3-dioxygenase-like lactoylglutathione lyase family enzyme